MKVPESSEDAQDDNDEMAKCRDLAIYEISEGQ